MRVEAPEQNVRGREGDLESPIQWAWSITGWVQQLSQGNPFVCLESKQKQYLQSLGMDFWEQTAPRVMSQRWQSLWLEDLQQVELQSEDWFKMLTWRILIRPSFCTGSTADSIWSIESQSPEFQKLEWLLQFLWMIGSLWQPCVNSWNHTSDWLILRPRWAPHNNYFYLYNTRFYSDMCSLIPKSAPDSI